MNMGLSEEFRRVGLAICPHRLTTGEVDLLNAEIERVCASGFAGTLLERDGRTPRSLANPQVVSRAFDALPSHPALVEPARALLGEDVYVFQIGVNMKAAFDGDVWPWHRDFPTYHVEDHIPAPRMANMLICLDDMDAENGALEFIPGSHSDAPANTRMSDGGTTHVLHYAPGAELENALRRRGASLVVGRAGDIFAMHTNTLHGSGPNPTHRPRKLITLTFNAMTNKATAPSRRSRTLVLDDRALGPVVTGTPDCLWSAR